MKSMKGLSGLSKDTPQTLKDLSVFVDGTEDRFVIATIDPAFDVWNLPSLNGGIAQSIGCVDILQSSGIFSRRRYRLHATKFQVRIDI